MNDNHDAPESSSAAHKRNADKRNDDKKDDEHVEPQPSRDPGKKIAEGVSIDSELEYEDRPECSTPNINTARPSISIASPNVSTGNLHINTISPTVITRRSNQPPTASHMFSLGNNSTPEASNANLFGEET
ncbi:hypothetical protein Tco_0420060, partial [Tanacetum coccineum]